VRVVDHVFVLQRWIAARQPRDDVLRVDRAHGLLERHRRGQFERHRRELARARARFQLLVVLSGEREQPGRGVQRQPALDRGAPEVLVRRDQIEALAAESLHHAEVIARRARLVDDEAAAPSSPPSHVLVQRP
jgi:hypothetical protein